jgi:hypothetical protein
LATFDQAVRGRRIIVCCGSWAIYRDASMQTLLLDAIDLLMAREGQGERWETRRKALLTDERTDAAVC